MGLREYFEKEYHLVSRWWKYALLAILVIDVVVVTSAVGCYDGVGELGEHYFRVNKIYMYVGFSK